MTAPAGTTQQAPGKQAAAKTPVMLKPFKIGVQTTDDDPFDRTVTIGAGTTNLDQYEVSAEGFLEDIYILIQNTVTSSTATATGTGAVGVPVEDGIFMVINQIVFTDTNSSEIMGPITGWDLAMIQKWGGYTFKDDPRANPDLYSVTSNATASSSAAGSFSVMLRIPVELVPRDALGSLPNKSSSTPFKVKITVNSVSGIYVNNATVGGSCRFRFCPKQYWEPTATDGSGNAVANQPPGQNTTQYWNVTEYTLASGTFSQLLTNSVGFPVRNLGFSLKDSNGSRAQGELDFPNPFQLQLQSNLVINRIKELWKRQITESYDYGGGGFLTAGTGDGVGQKDNGLYWETYCDDFGPKPGWEMRRKYLRTTDGMRLQAKGSIGGTGVHKLKVFTNYVGVGQGSTLAQITT